MAPEPRDVLAERIAQWAGDASVYDYADRLLKDLDAAGLGIYPVRSEHYGEETGGCLLASFWFPEENPENDAEEVADVLVNALNKARSGTVHPPSEKRVSVSWDVFPQWITPKTIEVIKEFQRRANEGGKGGGEQRG